MTRDYEEISSIPDGEDDSAQDHGRNDEEESNGCPTEGDEDDSGYYLHRLQRLLRLDQRNESPHLSALVMRFERPVHGGGMPSLTKENFEARLVRFLRAEDPNCPTLSPDLVDFLFKEAVDAQK